jgi:sRNA-binding protein
LRRCKEDATRVDLNGNPDGKVTADQSRRARVPCDWVEESERRRRASRI